MTLASGATVLQGRFRVERLIGAGAMGEVYQAEQLSLGRPVAIKRLRPELVRRPDMSERFRREARLLSTVEHPVVVRIIDFGEEDGTFLLVMERVDGVRLLDALRDGPMLPDRAIDLLVPLAEGLAAVHDAGIVHRDLNPKNVMLVKPAQGESVRLLDFGVARLIDDAGAPGATGAGVVIGTPAYLSPEQARGEKATASSDLYALGLMAYQMLSGRLPFDAKAPGEWIRAHQDGAPVPLADAAPHLKDQLRLCDAVMRCLSKSPGERPSSARAWAAKLAELPRVGEPTVLSDSLIVADTLVRPSAQSAPPAVVSRWPGRAGAVLRRPKVSAAVGLLVVLGLVAVLWPRPSQSVTEARAALAELKPKAAATLIEKLIPRAKGGDRETLIALRAAALHRAAAHDAEQALLSQLPGDSEAWREPELIWALLEDAARQPKGDAPARLARVPTGEVALLAKPAVREAAGLKRWAAIRFLDAQKLLDERELVRAYVDTLTAKECGIRGAAARRLGELGDPSATPALQKLKATPKSGGLFTERNCGQDEAAAALAALKKKARP